MDTTQPTPTVTGVTDTRTTPLDRLAAGGQSTAAVSLRNVLPVEEPQRVSVCAFASSI